MSLKFGIIYNPPLINKCALDRFCPQRGTLIETTNIFCQSLHLNCTFAWFNSTEYGDTDENGIGSGMIGAIQKGTFDASLPDFTPTYRRFKAISFSQLFDIDEIVLMTRASQENELNWKIVQSFQTNVWIVFILSLLSMAIILVLASLIMHQSSAPLDTFFNMSTSLIQKKFETYLLKFESIRVIVGTWTISALVLTSAYTGVLFSQKISAKPLVPFKDLSTFVDCLEQGQCQLVSKSNSTSFLQQLTTPNDALGLRMANSLRTNPLLVEPAELIASKILEEKRKYLVCIGGKTSQLYLVNRNRDCSFYILPLGLTEVNAFPISKKYPNLERINRMTLAIREFGTGQLINRKYLKDSVCDVDSSKATKSIMKGQLYGMSTIFWFYLLGISIGLLIICVELMISKCLQCSIYLYFIT